MVNLFIDLLKNNACTQLAHPTVLYRLFTCNMSHVKHLSKLLIVHHIISSELCLKALKSDDYLTFLIFSYSFLMSLSFSAFSKQSQLSYHKTTHSEERNFPCSACGKRFKRRKHLAVHARSHDDAKPYACDKCEMR